MKYSVVDLTLTAVDPWRELLICYLSEGAYDSFVETPSGLEAYIPTDQFDPEFLNGVLEQVSPDCRACYTVKELPDQDWNAEWEKTHQPVLVEDFCWVRAPFHPHRDDVKYEIEIEPKMSFGTAHHATTYMMLSYLRDLDVENLRVLDMGSGTAVLAILASLRGAGTVDAVDVDEWAYNNAIENIQANHCGNITPILGDASTLKGKEPYQLILANINRNILLNDMGSYAEVLSPNGTLLLSGFYEQDIPVLEAKAHELGLHIAEKRTRDNWAALRLER